MLVCDTGRPRNAASHALHGYLTRDGIAPAEFLAIGRRELEPYDTVQFRAVGAVAAECVTGARFKVTLADGTVVLSRKLLLATGVVDNLPAIDCIEEFYGRSVFHCPYCDGWEVRDTPIAVYGRGQRGVGLSLELTAWSRGLVLCTDGASEIDADDFARLARNGITVRRGARLPRSKVPQVSSSGWSSPAGRFCRGARCSSRPVRRSAPRWP